MPYKNEPKTEYERTLYFGLGTIPKMKPKFADTVTQNVEKLSLDLIFHDNFWENIKSFRKQNSELRIQTRQKSIKTNCLPSLLQNWIPYAKSSPFLVK